MMLLAIILIFIAVISASEEPRWKLVWNDEFDHFDNSKWTFAHGNNHGYGNNELEFYTDKNHFISNGVLTIQARKEKIEGFEYTSTKITT
jgi:beta-glucanase (GH16 family)